MARYIDADKLIDELREDLAIMKADAFTRAIAESTITLLQEYPTADVVEVKRGEWKDRYGNKHDNHLYECSVCGKKALYEFYKNVLDNWEERQALTPVCPHCGAKMDGGNNG